MYSGRFSPQNLDFFQAFGIALSVINDSIN